MQLDGTEKAQRAADLLYSFAAIVVFTLILPSAILVATFFILAPVIPNEFVRILLSTSVGVFVGASLLLLTGRRGLGSALHFASITLATISLSIGWGTLHAAIVCFHGALVGYYLIFFSLKRKDALSIRRWILLRNLLSILIVGSGPTAVRATLVFYGILESMANAAFLVIMLLYIMAFHVVYRNVKFGIVEVILASISGGFVADYILVSAIGGADFPLAASSFMIGSGLGMLAAAQIIRKAQFYIYSRPVKKEEKVAERDRILSIMGIDLESKPEGEPEPEEQEVEMPLIPVLINPEDGQALSGVSMILLAAGIPIVFLWLARLTEWGLLPEFIPLMVPIALLLASLVAAPAPVFLRLSRRITRDRESLLVRAVGLVIVVTGCSIVFTWTQYFAWQLVHSSLYASLLFLAGITGLFRRIRRLWRTLWLGIVRVFRAIKRWILAHILLAGIIADSMLTAAIVSLILPSFLALPASFVSLPAATAISFSFIALVGLTSLKRHPHRFQFASIAYVVLLFSLVLLTFWQQYLVLAADLVSSLAISSIWLLGSVALLQVKHSNRRIAMLYIPGVAGALFLVFTGPEFLLLGFIPVLTLMVGLLLLAPLVYEWYIRVGLLVLGALKYVGGVLSSAIRSFGGFLKRFIFISWAVLLIVALAVLGFYVVLPIVESDPVRALSVLAVLFFAGYFPMLSWEGRTPDRMLTGCIIAMALALGIAVFVFLPLLQLPSRIILGYASASLVLTVFKNNFSESARPKIILSSYCSFLALGALEVFYHLSGIAEIQIAVLGAVMLFGVGMLPLKRIGIQSSWADVAYGILAIPSGSLLTYFLTGDFLFTGLALLLLPVPIAYRKYIRGARVIGRATITGIRFVFVFAAINLVIVFALLAIVVSGLVMQYLAPFFSQYPIPEIPLSLTYATIALLFWLPALFIRRGEHSKLFLLIVPILAVVISVNLAVLLSLPDLIQTGAVAITLVLLIITLTRRLYPERIRDYLIPLTLSSMLFLGSWSLFLYLLPTMGMQMAALISLLAGGLSTLLLKATSAPEKIVNTLYLLLTLPAGIAIVYILGFGHLGVAFSILFIPVPVAYRLYIRFLAALASALLLSIRVVMAYVAIYFIIAMGAASIILSGALIYLLLPVFATWTVPILPAILSFLVLLILLWLPALFMQRSDNQSFVSVVLILFAAVTSFDVVVLIQIADPVLAILTAAILFGILLLFSSSYITIFRAIRPSFAITFGSAVLLGAYYMPVDFVMKGIIIVLGYSCISLMFLSDRLRMLVSYPLITSSALCAFFWHLYVMGIDPVGVGLAYICTESLMLSFAKEIRSKPLWWFFSIVAALFVAWFLSPFSYINLVLALFVAIELIRYTPIDDFDIEELALPFGFIRSALLAVAAYLFLSANYSFMFSLQASVFVFVVILHFSVRHVVPLLFAALTSLAAAAVGSVIIYTYCVTTLLSDPILSLYPSVVPVALFSYLRAVVGPYRRAHWFMLSSTMAVCFGLPWFIYYGTLSSLILVATTVFFVLITFQLWRPKDGFQGGIAQVLFVLSLVLCLESFWIWHAVLVFLYPPTIILAGSSMIALILVLLPATESLSWLKFEIAWELLCGFFAITVSALICGWEITTLTLPPSLILYTGLALSLFSAAATPSFAFAEGRLKMDSFERVGHYTWLPSLLGWPLLGAFVVSIFTTDLLPIISISGVLLSIAGIIYGALVPHPPRRIFDIFNIILATSVCGCFAAWNQTNLTQPWFLLILAVCWYLIAIPVTIKPTLRFFTWLVGVIRRNLTTFLKALPPVFGLLVALPFASNPDPIPILGLYIRNYAFAFSIGLIAAGILYLLVLSMYKHRLPQYLKVPTLLLLALGVNGYILAATLPAMVVAIDILVIHVSIAAITSCILLTVLALGTGQTPLAKQAFGVLGLAVGTAVFREFLIGQGASPFVAMAWALGITLIFEIPFLWRYALLILTNIFSLGTLLMKALRVLAKKLAYLFDRFGLIMWTLFSGVFTVTLAIATYPFFSELMNMPSVGFLYPVPSVSIPMMILGLMLLAVAIVRRRVKSRFGTVSGFLSAVGFGISATVGLYDNGHPYLAVFVAVFCVCLTGLIIREEIEISEEYVAIFWVPIPLSISSITFYYLYTIANTLEAQILAVFLAIFPAICLFLVSTLFGWIPKKMRNTLWTTLSVLSGLIAYLSSYLAVYPFLASVYLSVLIAALVLFPVTGRKMTQLFLAPVAFAVTGFAFTFVLGEFYQSLLLGLAAFLLFISRFLKRRERENPQLVYIRLAVLVALVISIALFVVTLFLFAPVT